jgi:peptidoglycan/LPS O-acetylase OafA/YrhL
MPPRSTQGAGSVHLQGLDVTRAIAITLVLLFHYSTYFAHPDELWRWSQFGWTGVDLFFVLSGYLISSQLLAAKARDGISLGSYFIKRSFRILPLFWLTLAAYFLMPEWREREALAPLWKYLTFTENIYWKLDQRTFSHAWSLCIEEQFYLALPFVLLWVGRRQTLKGTFICLSILSVFGLFVRWLSWEALAAYSSGPVIVMHGASFNEGWFRWIYYCTWTRLDGLLTGVVIASLFHFRKDIKSWALDRSLYFGGTAIVGLVWAAWICTPPNSYSSSLYGYPLISLSFGCLLVAVLSPRFQLPSAIFFPFKWLATLSYGIYLSHKMVGHVAQRMLTAAGVDGKGYPMFIACIAAFVLVGLVLHWAVERPMFVLRDRVLKLRRDTASSPPV